MATKTTAAEINAFFADVKWWQVGGENDTWFEDALFTVSGAEDDDPDFPALPPESPITVDGGRVFGFVVGTSEPSLCAYLKRWRKEQASAFVSIEIPKEKLPELRAFMKLVRGKVVGGV